jgi:pilus assembly protein CpaD
MASHLAIALLTAASLTACATTGGGKVARLDEPVLPTESYPLQAQTMTKSISLRINPNGLSDNQRIALDQLAAKANWLNGEPVNVEIVTSGDPRAVSAGRMIGGYLSDRAVSDDNMSQVSVQEQPADIVTINTVYYRARTYACNETWENLTETRDNKPYKNFGCAVNSNLAAMIADPRDLDTPAAATPTDTTRKVEIIGKFQKGEKTSSATDDGAKGSISNAIK